MIVDPRIGTRLAGYRIEALLGRGGMSVVYRAEQARPRRYVALKLLSPGLAENDAFRQRFLRESELAAATDHPNILPVYDAGEAGGVLYIAMRYVEGVDLKVLLAREGRLEPGRALAIAGQVAGALDAAHTLGLVHRDVKPGNILLAAGGTAGGEHAYLADFGLTKRADSASQLTVAGQVLGTVDYVAPEQIEGERVDGRADQYSLACVLFECLTGSVPFPRETELAVLWAHVQQPPPRLSAVATDLPPRLDAAVARALAKPPGDRFPTCGELVAAVEQELDELGEGSGRPGAGVRPGAARTARPSPRPARPGRRLGSPPEARPRKTGRRPLAVFLAILLVGLVGLPARAVLLRGRRTAGRVAAPVAAADTAVRIDPATGGTVAAVTIRPAPTAVTTGDGWVWVVSTPGGVLTKIDPGTNQVQQTIRFPTPSGAGSQRPGVAFGNHSVWVADRIRGAVERIDPDGGIVTRIKVEDPSAIALGPSAAWVTSGRSATVVPVDVGSNQVGTPIRVGRAPTGVAVDPDGKIWVANHGDKTLSRVRPGQPRQVETIRLPAVPDQVAAGAGAVWVTSGASNSVLRVDPATGAVKQIRAGAGPSGIAAGSDQVWVAAGGDGTVSSIDAKSASGGDAKVGTIRLGFRPVSVAVDTGAVWVALAA
jgi:DNA-binding beta-propeller fold protein YncE